MDPRRFARGRRSQAAMFSANTTAPSGSSVTDAGAHEQQMGVEAVPDVTGERLQDAHVILQSIPSGDLGHDGSVRRDGLLRPARQRVGW